MPNWESLFDLAALSPRGRAILEAQSGRRRLDFEQQRLDELIAQGRRADEARYIDPAEFARYLPPGMRGEMPTFERGRVPIAVFERTFPLWQAEVARRRSLSQGGDIADYLERAYAEPRSVPGLDIEAASATGEPPKPTTTTEVPQRISSLAALLRRLGATERTLPLIEKELGPEETVEVEAGKKIVGKRTWKTLAEGGPKLKTELRQGKDDTYVVVTDEAGNVVGEPIKSGIGVAGSKAPFTREDIEAALAEAGWAPDMLGYREAYLNLARQVTVQPGGQVYGAGQLIIPPPPRVAVPSAGPGRPAVTGQKPLMEGPPQVLSPEEAGSLGVPYGTTREGAAGRTPLSAAQRTKMDAQASVLAMVDKMESDLADIAKPTRPLGRIWAAPKALWSVYGQADPKLSAFHSRIEATLALIVRALGEVGTLTDRDIARARSLQPVVAPIPDTEDVVREKLAGLRDLVRAVAARTGTRPETLAPKVGGQADPLGIRR